MDDSKKAFQSCVFAHIQINPGEEQPYRTSMVIRQGALQKLIFFFSPPPQAPGLKLWSVFRAVPDRDVQTGGEASTLIKLWLGIQK